MTGLVASSWSTGWLFRHMIYTRPIRDLGSLGSLKSSSSRSRGLCSTWTKIVRLKCMKCTHINVCLYFIKLYNYKWHINNSFGQCFKTKYSTVFVLFSPLKHYVQFVNISFQKVRILRNKYILRLIVIP